MIKASRADQLVEHKCWYCKQIVKYKHFFQISKKLGLVKCPYCLKDYTISYPILKFVDSKSANETRLCNVGTYRLKENDEIKIITSPRYNYVYNKKNNSFSRWGDTQNIDLMFALSPEIVDLEISSKHEQSISNMTFSTFKIIFDKIPKFLTQIVFHISDTTTNPDLFKMMEYSRKYGIMTNCIYSGSDIIDDHISKMIKLCRSIVINLIDKEKTFQLINKLILNKMKNIYINFILSKQSLDEAFKLIDEIKERKMPVKAIIFSQYKSKEMEVDKFEPVTSVDIYKKIIDYSRTKQVNILFDSCSCALWYKSIEKTDQENLANYGNQCESGIFNGFINYKGEFFPCSFIEGTNDWEEGLNILSAENFISDVWNHDRIKSWRINLYCTVQNCCCKFKRMCKKCPVYNVIHCKGQYFNKYEYLKAK
jgi:hypothetical protein